jgi:AraC family transcriptional regulator
VRINPSDARFYGRVLRARRVADLTLTETAYPPSAVVPPHAHDSSRLCFVLEGGFAEVVGGVSKRCGPGSLLFHPSGEPHAQQFDDTTSRCLTVHLGPRFEARLSELGIQLPPAPISARQKGAWLAVDLYEEFCRPDGASHLANEGLCLAVVAEMTRDAASRLREAQFPRWLRVVQGLVDARYLEPLRLAELAEAVDVHPVHLSRAFHERLGVTLTAYVRERRLEWASERLLRTDLPSSRIAVEAGFRDHGHFTRAFKQATGKTPREFRAAIAGPTVSERQTRGGP